MHKYLSFSPEVKEALEKGIPVVALETNLVATAMPYPHNVEVTREVMRIMKEEGVMPALIAVKDGKIKIGLTEEEIELFGKSKDVAKISRWDIAEFVASNKIGATTVASTMVCAALAGIKFFVTGGPGGVHRDWQKTLDISADLDEFAISDVAVICSGPKCILDLPATLEYLETKGVPVIGYGVKNLPSFLVRDSGLPLQISYNNVKDIVNMIRVKWELGLKGGVVIANPIPEKEGMNREYFEEVMSQIMKDAEEQKIVGKAVTPFIQKRLIEITGGESMESNKRLFINNAKLGAQLALEYYRNK